VGRRRGAGAGEANEEIDTKHRPHTYTHTPARGNDEYLVSGRLAPSDELLASCTSKSHCCLTQPQRGNGRACKSCGRLRRRLAAPAYHAEIADNAGSERRDPSKAPTDRATHAVGCSAGERLGKMKNRLMRMDSYARGAVLLMKQCTVGLSVCLSVWTFGALLENSFHAMAGVCLSHQFTHGCGTNKLTRTVGEHTYSHMNDNITTYRKCETCVPFRCA
jgi:hypothetical protein